MSAFTHSHKIAILAASGVEEMEMTAIQRALAHAKVMAKIITPETGLVNTWSKDTWGHSFASDAKLETSLGSDFDMLIMPGGRRHIDKLMTNPHTKRFVSAFFAMNKAVAAFSESQDILNTNGLDGENTARLSYDDPQGLLMATEDMIVHFQKYDVPSMMDMDDEQAA